MKIRMTFKTPDVMEDAIEEAIRDEKDRAEDEGGGVDVDDLRTAATAACKKWVEYGESISVEVDTETGTCTVTPV